jgi:hypothetical protein
MTHGVSSVPNDLPEPRRQDETRRTVDLGHSSHGPSWIDLAEIRVNVTESRFVACLNRLLQQNRPNPDITRSPRWCAITAYSSFGGMPPQTPGGSAARSAFEADPDPPRPGPLWRDQCKTVGQSTQLWRPSGVHEISIPMLGSEILIISFGRPPETESNSLSQSVSISRSAAFVFIAISCFTKGRFPSE